MLEFGKSYTWDDGVRVTVGKPTEFEPSAFAVVEKSKRYLKFTVTVVNKSDKPIDLGLTYISVQSNNEQAHDVFDSGSGLRGPPTTKVLKGRESQLRSDSGSPIRRMWLWKSRSTPTPCGQVFCTRLRLTTARRCRNRPSGALAGG
jgi:hypothetical protein